MGSGDVPVMQFLLYPAVERCAGGLDHIRSTVLRTTLQIQSLRPFFYRRDLRLALLFSIACISALILSMWIPLWVLLLGPLVYGVPHIFSSMRYFHFAVSDQLNRPVQRSRLFAMTGFILVCVFSYRLVVTVNAFGISTPQLSEWRGSTYVELIALAITFIGASAIYRKSLKIVLRGLGLLIPFIAAFYFYPAIVIGAMVLIHNFIAFIYWVLAAKTPSERKVAWGAFVLTLGVTLAIFYGYLDILSPVGGPHLMLDFARLSILDTGRLIAPWSQETSFWIHACNAFAFGQSLHYFVWLKAIPDQNHYHDVPTSFRQSLGLLENDFGKSVAHLLVFLCVGSLIVWSLMSFQMARMVYFCLASYHGYLEIAGLGIVRSQTARSV